jgi:predicted MFS family arabinose efflux permease
MSQQTPSATGSQHVGDDCPLPARLQTRNMLCLVGLWCLIYLTAPVSYVGVTQANLLHALGNNDTVANLPHAVYVWMTGVPILVAWLLPQPRWLKPLIVGALSAEAAATTVVAAVLWLQMPAFIATISVIAYAGVFGAANGILLMSLWEVVRRGVSTARRGMTLGFAFGVGPIAACIGSLIQQMLLSHEPLTGATFAVPFPDNYLALFAGAIPVWVMCVFLGAAFVVPLPAGEVVAPSRVAEILRGMRQFVTSRPVALGAVAYFLVYSGGNAIFDNVSLHAKEVLGSTSPDTVGLQNFLRFGFKAVAGALLGWLLAKAHPKATLLATTSLLLAGMAWAMNASGWWYLLTAGLLGAGELFGAYFPNYVATASPKSQVRANIAYLNLLGGLVGFAPVIFGAISDRFGRIASFHAATGVLIFAIVLIVVALPARPTPHEDATPP